MDRERLKQCLIMSVAKRCAASGFKRIALYGAGRHTIPITRQPWQWEGVEVVAILDDAPRVGRVRGVPVVRPGELTERVDAVVISSDRYERELYLKAQQEFEPRGVAVLRIYADEWMVREEPGSAVRRLVARGIDPVDAQWLMDHRDERHDATLPMLPPERTEMHLRRYEFAAGLVEGKRVLDLASGTGYGSRLLLDQGRAASVVGMDCDRSAVEYARRRHGAGVPSARLRYQEGSATGTTLAGESVDVVVSFETIEHVPEAEQALREFARVLATDGLLVMSTPNDSGPTEHHAHSFTRETFEGLVRSVFGRVTMFGQVAGDQIFDSSDIPGVFGLEQADIRPAIFIAVARR